MTLTTKYRERELATCEKLKKELKEDGTPKYPTMEANAELWREINEIIGQIQDILA